MSSPRIFAKPGWAPPSWPDRNAIFFGDRAEVRALEPAVGGVKSPGARLAPILNLLFKGSAEENTLILRSAPCPQREHLEKAPLACLSTNVRACENWSPAVEQQVPVDWERGRD